MFSDAIAQKREIEEEERERLLSKEYLALNKRVEKAKKGPEEDDAMRDLEEFDNRYNSHPKCKEKFKKNREEIIQRKRRQEKLEEEEGKFLLT